MKLIRHQLQFDLVQFRTWLIAWVSLLGMDLLTNLGYLFPLSNSSQNGVQTLMAMLPGVIVGLGCFSMVLGVGVLFTGGSPFNPESFNAIRAMPRRDWMIARLMFLGLFVLLPCVLQEAIYLALCNLSPSIVLHGALERLVFLVPVCVVTVCLALLSRNLKKLFTTFAFAFFLTWLLGVLLIVLTQLVFKSYRLDGDIMASRGLVFLYLLMFWMLGMSLFVLRLRWHARLSFVLTVAGSMTTLVAALAWDKDIFPSKPLRPGDMAEVAEKSHFTSSLRSMQFQTTEDRTKKTKNSYRVDISLHSELALTNAIVEWLALSGRIETQDKRRISEYQIEERQRRIIPSWNSFYSLGELRVLSQLCPSGAWLYSSSLAVNANDRLGIGEYPLPNRTDMGDKLRDLEFSVNLEGRVYEWQRAADLELIPGTRFGDATGSWEVLGWQDDMLQVERRQVNLGTSTDETKQISRYWPSDRFVFMLYDPVENKIRTPPSRFMGSPASSTHTAYSRHLVMIHFPKENQGGESYMRRYEKRPASRKPHLLVFRKSFLGVFNREMHWAHLNLPEENPQGSSRQYGNRVEASDVNPIQRFRTIKKPDPNSATQAEVRSYLNECLRLAERAGVSRSSEPDSLMEKELSGFVPQHLPVFIEALNGRKYVATWVLLHAVRLGADEIQKGRIIDELKRNPDLVSVISERGWIADARSSLLELLRTPRQLPMSYWQAVAWLQAPETYPLLLEQLETTPYVWLYDYLLTLPGIQPDLDKAIDRLLSRLPMSMPRLEGDTESGLAAKSHGWIMTGHGLPIYPVLEIAMKNGKYGAFVQAYRIFTAGCMDPTIGNEIIDQLSPVPVQALRPKVREALDYEIIDVLKRTVLLDGLKWEERWDNKKVAQWLLEHNAEEFQFDPVRRLYMLKKRNNREL